MKKALKTATTIELVELIELMELGISKLKAENAADIDYWLRKSCNIRKGIGQEQNSLRSTFTGSSRKTPSQKASSNCRKKSWKKSNWCRNERSVEKYNIAILDHISKQYYEINSCLVWRIQEFNQDSSNLGIWLLTRQYNWQRTWKCQQKIQITRHKTRR